jgi:hypothetical protein
MTELPSILEEPLIVRLVPISAAQIRVLESVEQAFFSLVSDFHRDFGPADGSEIAGGLYRIWSSLGVITTCWKEGAEDVDAAEQRRAALERIGNDGLSAEEARQIAREALR